MVNVQFSMLVLFTSEFEGGESWLRGSNWGKWQHWENRGDWMRNTGIVWLTACLLEVGKNKQRKKTAECWKPQTDVSDLYAINGDFSCRAKTETGVNDKEPDGHGSSDSGPGGAEVTRSSNAIWTSLHGEVCSVCFFISKKNNPHYYM